MRASERCFHPHHALIRLPRFAPSSFRQPRWLPLLLAMVAFLLGGCAPPPKPLTQDAYIWQRHWTPAVPSAMQVSGDLVRTWHVLAGELDANGDWVDVAPNWTALKSPANAKPRVVMVMRIDGQVNDLQSPASIAHIVAAMQRWQQAGVKLAGLEIDHDCATARLPAYTQFLTALRLQMPQVSPAVLLSITALPTWLESPALDKLLAAADEAVLQVHAVLNPRQGLFDAKLAQTWLAAFAKRTDHPWRVALPTYGTRVTWDTDGRIAAIQSESPASMQVADDSTVASELVARPEAMATFVAQIEGEPPHGLAGPVWFRLPTGDDTRAWSLPTWRAVLAREPLTPELTVSALPGVNTANPDLRDVMLVNTGNADASLPSSVRLDSGCRVGDGINGYALETDTQGMYLRRTQDGLLRAGRQRNIGWLLCHQKNITLHVQS